MRDAPVRRADPVDRALDVGGAAARTAGDDDGQLIALSAVEGGEPALDRARAGHLEAAAREVLGLTGGEGERAEQDGEPGKGDQPAVSPGEPVEAVHRRLHVCRIVATATGRGQ